MRETDESPAPQWWCGLAYRGWRPRWPRSVSAAVNRSRPSASATGTSKCSPSGSSSTVVSCSRIRSRTGSHADAGGGVRRSWFVSFAGIGLFWHRPGTRQSPVPCGRRGLTPRLERGALERRALRRSSGRSAPSACWSRPSVLCVGATARRREVRLGEEHVDRVRQWRAGAPPGHRRQTVGRGLIAGMRRLDRLLW